MNSLEELLEKHPLDAKMENTEVTVDWLAAKCDAMQLKIRYAMYTFIWWTIKTVFLDEIQ